MATPATTPTPSPPAPRRSRLTAALTRRRNPLRRRTDSQRTWLRALTLLGLGAAVALSALLAQQLYRSDRATALQQRAPLHQVQADVLTDVARVPVTPDAGLTAQVRWTDTDGTTHSAVVDVPASTTKGGHLSLWLDATGQPRTAPGSAEDWATSAAYLGATVLVGSVFLLAAARSLARAHLDRTDLHNWEQGWNRVEPLWADQNRS